MKLLVDARTLGSHPSGIGMYIYDFLKELIQDSRFEIVLLSDVATSDEITALARQNLSVVTYGKPVVQSAAVFSYFRFVQDSLDYYQPDLFWEPNNLIPVRIRRFPGRILVTLHDVFPITQPKEHGFVYSHYFQYALQKTLRQTHMITYNSEETRREVERLYPQTASIPHQISYIIVNKPDYTDAPITPDVLFPGTRLDGEDYFLYVGNLEKRKGTDLLLQAYVKYRQLGGRKKLYLGGLIREADIQQLYDTVHQQFPDVLALGYVNREQKTALYHYCAGFLFPSRAEGFGIPIIEAMHFRKPILASNLSIFHEITGDAISYFDCSGTAAEQTERLAQAMLELNGCDLAAYQTITDRYLPERLGKAFCDFLYDGCASYCGSPAQRSR